jgi:hypothetical protein
VAVPLAHAEELPLPSDVGQLHEPHELIMGSRPIKVQGFTTDWSLTAVRAFYEKTLPKRGWQVKQPPWMETVQAQLKDLKQMVRDHPEALERNPQLKSQLTDGDPRGMSAFMKRQLYAIRGTERLLLNLSARGRGTLVFVNRWQEQAGEALSPSGEARHADAGFPAHPLWPQANPCCSGEEEVPAVLRKLPESIPRYPKGRMISAGAAPAGGAGGGIKNELYLSDDSVDEVMEFYRHHMTLNGWSPVDLPEGFTGSMDPFLSLDARAAQTRLVAFQKDHKVLCGIVAAEQPAGSAQVFSGATGRVKSRSTERTIILVNYIESPFLNRSLGYTPPAALKGKGAHTP